MFVGMGANSAGGYNLENSLRFRSSASAYLSRTPATASNRRTWTWSGWVKRGNLNQSHNLFSVRISAATRTVFRIVSDEIDLMDGDTNFRLTTTAVFRDPSAWYHIVLVCDTTQATSTDRIKLYVNGEQVTAFSPATYPSLDFQTNINNTLLHAIGVEGSTTNDYLDGYLTEVNFVDGQALTASDFGETNEDTGVWQPKEYTGTYGTNGFYLDMSTSGSTVTDQSGNGNNWTANNMNLTTSTATTYDIMTDVPTLTAEDTANFAVLNPLVQSAGSFSDGNLKATMTSSTPAKFVSTIAVTSGTWYMEYSCNWGSTTIPVGISADTVPRNYLGMSDGNTSVSFWPNVSSTNMYINGVLTSWSGSATTWTSTDICGLALDATNKIIYVYKNGSLIGSYNFSALNWNEVYFAGGNYINGLVYNANFGQQPFAYTPPTGYLKLNTFNLPDSSIVDGSQYFDAVTYTGNGASQTIALNFSPDFVWLKGRSIAYDNFVFDSVRGINPYLITNSTAAETSGIAYVQPNSPTGFTLGNNAFFNQNGQTFVSWSWRGSDSSAVSNTEGSITSTVSANPTAGFSIVTWTATTGTVGHGLGTAPELIIEKRRSSTSDWLVQTTAIDGSNDYLRLNTNVGKTNGAGASPTATVFTPNTGSGDVVAYCFHSVAGYSSIGSYTGNANANGPFVYTGFRPAFMLFKRTDAANDWYLYDSARDEYNLTTQQLYPNLINAEAANSNSLDLLSNGFKIRTTGLALNASGGTFIYMAFAENPFKNSLAR